MRLNPAQIASLAAAAGFQGDDLTTAVAVALAESGGDTAAYNPERQAGTPAGKGSYGIWQIYLNAHPEFIGWNLLDPATNAMAAFRVYSAAGNRFRPWAAFKSGSYSAYLDTAQAGVIADASAGQVLDGDAGANLPQASLPQQQQDALALPVQFDLSQVPAPVWIGIAAILILLLRD